VGNRPELGTVSGIDADCGMAKLMGEHFHDAHGIS
jgi:hypothetical protein